MRNNRIFQYYVEGEDEKSIINALKQDVGCIESGKVEKFNVVQNRFTIARIRPLKKGTVVVLVYDTDVEKNTEILEYNINFLKKQKAIKDVACIPQVKNLEDELVRACEIRHIGELTKSGSKKEYKRDLISCTNLGNRLHSCNFDILKFWSKVPQNIFRKFGNDADEIKCLH